MAVDLSSGRGDGGGVEWLDPRRGSGHGMERARDLKEEETESPR